MKIIPVVLSGGSGTRLWPLSRSQYPKQFCELMTESLLAQTLGRLKTLGEPWVLTLAEMGQLTRRVFAESSLPTDQIILEPSARNTAPAIAFLCRYFQTRGEEDSLAGVFPADHLISDQAAFRRAIEAALPEAQNGKIVTLGVRPTYAATGFGYIELAKTQQTAVKPVLGFREKPNFETAEEYVRSGNFVWNAGIFLFKISAMIEALREHTPEIWEAVSKIKPDLSNATEVYSKLPAISIDYAVMERHKKQACVPCDIGWSDLGSWDDIGGLIAAGHPGVRNFAETISTRSRNCVGFATDRKLIAFVGVDDVMAIDTPDALLVVKKGASQHVREIVDELGRKKHRAIEEHGFEVRPWGRFEVLKADDNYKLKKITVDPGARISLQSHEKRSETWFVVAGKGEVSLDGKIIPVRIGTTVSIPMGAKHRIQNTGTDPLQFIEVQVGSYFGEDDIIRYQDDYNRL